MPKKGFKMTEEQKRKISMSKIGKKNPKCSETKKRLYSEGKLIPWNKGQKDCFSEETRLKMSESNKGQIPWNKGMIYDQEWKDKIFHEDTQIYAWNTGLTKDTDDRVKKASLSQTGKKKSEECKDKMSISKTKFYQEYPERKKDAADGGLKGLQSQRRKVSQLEILLRNSLDKYNIPYTTHPRINRYCIDILIEDNICVEADGKFWHSLPNIKEKDERKDTILKSLGFFVERFEEDEIRENPDKCVKKLIEKYPYLSEYKEVSLKL